MKGRKKTKKTKAKRNPGGAPSKYHAKHCKPLVDHLAKGLSFESFGATIGVHRDTLYEWAKVHPPFSDAKKLGEAHRELFLIRLGQAIALDMPVKDDAGNIVLQTGPKASASAWIFMAKNMLKWHDRQDVALSGSPGGAPIALERSEDESHEARLAELERLQKMREACGNE